MAVLALAACSASGSDDPDWQGDDTGYQACRAMGNWATDGQQPADRPEAFADANENAQGSTILGLADAGADLITALGSGNETLITAAADTFSQICLDQGYADT